MKRKPTKAQAMKWRLDLFGEVPVTREDVYAWLLAVVDIDPASKRAFGYVKSYRVVDKIIRAKINGTFEELVASAKHSSRLRTLADDADAYPSSNYLGLGDFEHGQPRQPPIKQLSAPRRPAEVVQQERERHAAEMRARKAVKATRLNRFPKDIPSLSIMLADISSPPAEALAEAFGVTTMTAKRWIEKDHAPLPVRLALYWLTRWGTSEIDERAHNEVRMATAEAACLRSEVAALRAQLESIGRIADFGSANDPLLNTPSTTFSTGYGLPISPLERGVKVIVNTLESKPCADSDLKKKCA